MTLISSCFLIPAVKLVFKDVTDLFQITYFSVSHVYDHSFPLRFKAQNSMKLNCH